jgi:hypothetical protein
MLGPQIGIPIAFVGQRRQILTSGMGPLSACQVSGVLNGLADVRATR